MNHKGASAVSLALLARWRDMREREGGRAESARPRAASSWHASGAYDSGTSHHARGACEVSRSFWQNGF